MIKNKGTAPLKHSNKMMSKRRQTLGIQIVGALTALMIVAYFFLPAGVTNTPSAANRAGRPITNLNELTVDDFQKQPMQKQAVQATDPNRVKAAFVILARNSDLTGVRYAMRQVEDRFNHMFNYPYVFLNEENFTTEFKTLTTSLTKADTFYGKIDPSMWGYPSYINETHAAECRKDMADRNIIYGGSESYRHMCRFQSGFFFRHPLLDNFEYYWYVQLMLLPMLVLYANRSDGKGVLSQTYSISVTLITMSSK